MGLELVKTKTPTKRIAANIGKPILIIRMLVE